VLAKKIIQIGAYEREPWMASKIRSVAPVRNTLTSSISLRGGVGVEEARLETNFTPAAQPRFQPCHHVQRGRSSSLVDAELSPAGMVGADQSEVTDAISHRAQAAST
jgi:hypothetical protein